MRGDHLFPDLALLGFARDVLENGRATALLWRSETPRAGFATARGAFEAAVDLLFLGTREDDYDYWGSRARASELLDWDHTRDLASQVESAEALPDTVPAAEQIKIDAATWDDLCSGKGELLLGAWDDVVADRAKRRWHWSGKARMSLPHQFAEATGGDENTETMYKAWYGVLSLHAHPSPRIETRHLQFVDGVFQFQISYSDPAEIASPALGSAYVAAVAAKLNLLTRLPGKET